MLRKIFVTSALIFLFALAGSGGAAQGMDRIDSRVIVIILESDKDKIIHNERATSIINAKLLKMGFKPVIDANHAIKLNDAQLLANVYNGYPDEFIRSLDAVTDYLIIGRCIQSENDIDFYDYYAPKTPEGSFRKMDNPLQSIRMDLKMDVIVYDTGEIVSTFSTSGIGFGNNTPQASKQAVELVVNEAAAHLEKDLKKLSNQTSAQYLFTIDTDDYEKLDQVVDDLRAVSSVSFVQIREQRGKTMLLSVEAYQPPSMIVRSLKEVTQLKFYVERLSGNSCSLRFSDKEISDEEAESRDRPSRKNFDDEEAEEEESSSRKNFGEEEGGNKNVKKSFDDNDDSRVDADDK